jgi:hypothetical protein
MNAAGLSLNTLVNGPMWLKLLALPEGSTL